MTDLLAQFHLVRPWALLLMLPATAIWWLDARRSDPLLGWRKAIAADLLPYLVVGGRNRDRVPPRDILLAGWAVAIVALAGPTFRQEPSPFAATARPAVLVLKVSPSMLTEDVRPTRLDRARQKIADLLELRTGAPTGFVAYSGSAHLVLPPTPDAGVIREMAAALSPDIMPRTGDAAVQAVALGNRLLESAGQGGSVVLIADDVPEADVDALRTVPNLLALPIVRPERLRDNEGWQALGSDVVAPTLDDADVHTLERRLERGAAPVIPGEGQRWQEAGYWLTPFIAALVLSWFRRGWVLA